MKFSKKYLLLVLLLALSMLWKLNNWNDKYAAVEPFRGATLKDEVFYPLMAKNINDSGELTVYLNNEVYSNSEGMIMLDNNLMPVCSLNFVQDVMYGSCYRYDDLSVILNYGDDVYEFLLDNSTATKNGDDYELGTAPSEYDGQVYIGIEDLCIIMQDGFSYDDKEHTVYISVENHPELPSAYDLREEEKVSQIRNQGSNNTCWACASLEALESSLLPYKKDIYSVDAMISDNSFNIDDSDGGKYNIALAYLLSWQGPKLEDSTEDKILNTVAGSDTSDTVHLQEVQFYDSEDLDDIKWAVYRYGGVTTSIYANVSTSNLNTSTNYNKKTNSYCYRGNEKPNHDVVIIGWDDSYPASYFSEDVPKDGAFICQNSWGSGFGDAGVFYISYYDTNVGNQAVSYSKVDTAGKYSNIYQSDLCGWVGQVGFNKEWAYGANVYTAAGSQQIEAAGFYALSKDTTYQLYFVPDYKNTSSLSQREMVAEGYLQQAGYYTIKFNEAKIVTEKENFAIVLYISTPGTERPLAVEYVDEDDDLSAQVDITDGKGFISNNGLDWECVEDAADANLCLKAYGNNYVEVLE